jgi:outer membrane lipoprotein-sorting protein
LKLILNAFLYFSLSVIVIIGGCVPSKPTNDVEILSSERLINKLEVNRRRIKSFEGNGTIIVRNSQVNNSALFRVVLQKPDSIYFTVFGPFGIELAQALVSKKDFIFYDVLNNTAYEGQVDSEILQDIFKIDLSFNDLVDAFIGSVNLTDHLYKLPTKYEVIYDKYLITYIDSTSFKSFQYTVDVRELGITEYVMRNKKGEILLEGRYSDFGIVEGVAVPYKIELVNKKENQQVVVEYRGISANKKNIYVDFKVPEDVTIIKW